MTEPRNESSGPAGTSAGEATWERVHPLTPLARFWIAILVIVFVVGRNVVESAFEDGWDPEELGRGIPEFVRSLELVGWLIGIGVVLLVLGAMFWSWWFTRYAVTEGTVRVREGALFRKEKQARLDRVQAIEISQPLLARLLGLAELRFEVADSGESTLHLRFLTRRGAEDLRARLLRRKRQMQDDAAPSSAGEAAAGTRGPGAGGAGPGEARDPGDVPEGSVPPAPGGAGTAPASGPAPEPDAAAPAGPSAAAPSAAGSGQEETELARVGVGRAVAALVAGGYGIFLLLALAAVVVLNIVSLPGISLAVLAPALFGLVTGGWGTLNSTANFRAGITGEGLKVRYGLTSTRTQTIPLGRIQAVGIEQPLLWRPFGWFKLVINSAGLGASGADSARNVLLPVGTGQELMRILPYVVERPERGGVDGRQLRAALEGSGTEHGFTVSPGSARWVDPLTYRRNGYGATRDLLLVRSGRLRRRLAVMPHVKVQSMRLANGPLDRRLGLADLHLHSVGGPVSGLVRHLALADAQELARRQAERAAGARRVGEPQARADCPPAPPGEAEGPAAAEDHGPADAGGPPPVPPADSRRREA
ncbi:PH domain-containing protein [Rothia halotolerans]|uniref:PH domain-containing protein n=1 Tax=Rothia halotolerans TaxID=405770 RepID=UPI00101D1EF5|nr:PH domain-containing protein [Rothia halotolerans]